MAINADFDWSEVGQRIRGRRLAQQKTQQQLANEAGLTQNGIFRLEVGSTNPQISTLRAVAKALGTSTRELLCGVADSDRRSSDRLILMRRILESGDEAAIRAMDYGLENARTMLDRTSGFWEKDALFIRVGGRTFRRSVPEVQVAVKGKGNRSSSKSQAESASARLAMPPQMSDSLKKEIHTMTGYQLDDAPHLPEGTGSKLAVPKSNRSEEHHEHSSKFATHADSESPRR
jgi:transcriptional regulator with XRE-family HTH domain